MGVAVLLWDLRVVSLKPKGNRVEPSKLTIIPDW